MKKALRIVMAIAMGALFGSSVMAQTFDYPVRSQQGFGLLR